MVKEHIPTDFLRADVQHSGTRHLVLATIEQLKLLSKAKTWYVNEDATFKVVKQPFPQLFSVYAFVKKDGHFKQLPLAFIVMSLRRKKDYKCVLRALIAALPKRPRVQSVVADFEAAVWSAVRNVLPGVIQRGCAFHFGQAVWRNVQSAGLQRLYTMDDHINHVCLQMMALPFLPAEVIADQFRTLQTASDNPHVVQHLEYMERNWINSSTWPPSAWSVFRQPVRTNSDVKAGTAV